MDIGELIAALEQVRSHWGGLQIYVESGGEYNPLEKVSIATVDDQKVVVLSPAKE